MNPFPSILVPLDGSATAARSLGVATWLATRLGGRLHVLSATPEVLPARDELQRLRVPEECWPHIELHQAPAYPEESILAAVTRHDARLIVMSTRGETADRALTGHPDPLQLVGHVTRAVIEQSPVPVLLAPPAYRERLPWKQALIPVSGEVTGDEALALAVQLGRALSVRLHVAHVTDSQADDQGLLATARYADAPHHEYPGRLEELVNRALPQCTAEERRWIAGVALCRGDIAAELLKLIRDKRIDLLVIGWHGRFMTGHALVLKQLVQVVSCPVLLSKPVRTRTSFRLKVGENIG